MPAICRSLVKTEKQPRGVLRFSRNGCLVEEKKSGGDEPRWDVKDVAAYLKVSPSWVYQRANAGEIPHHRYGAHLRFDPEVVRRYARGESVQPPRVVMFKVTK